MSASKRHAAFQWDDPLLLDAQLSDEERQVREAARVYSQDRLASRVLLAFREEKTDPGIFREMGELGPARADPPGAYGGAGLNHVCYGLVAREVERVRFRLPLDDECAEFAGDAAHPRLRQRGDAAEVLPGLASGRLIGCFGLTEPDHGSDPGSMITRARKVDGGYSLSGAKMWISNSPIADVFVVWAKDDEGQIRGFVLEKGWKG